MDVQINTDSNIEGDNALAQQAEAVVRETLHCFSEQITRVEVHLSDQNSDRKIGIDAMRCLLEVRVGGRPPIAVSDQAETVEQAVHGAAEKMEHSLTSALGRSDHR